LNPLYTMPSSPGNEKGNEIFGLAQKSGRMSSDNRRMEGTGVLLYCLINYVYGMMDIWIGN